MSKGQFRSGLSPIPQTIFLGSSLDCGLDWSNLDGTHLAISRAGLGLAVAFGFFFVFFLRSYWQRRRLEKLPPEGEKCQLHPSLILSVRLFSLYRNRNTETPTVTLCSLSAAILIRQSHINLITAMSNHRPPNSSVSITTTAPRTISKTQTIGSPAHPAAKFSYLRDLLYRHT